MNVDKSDDKLTTEGTIYRGYPKECHATGNKNAERICEPPHTHLTHAILQ
jgi:hypothetical protein